MTEEDRETLRNLLWQFEDELEKVAELTGIEPDISLYDAVSTVLSGLSESEEKTHGELE